ncbi:MAG: hypothetical protein ACRDWH_02455, partial [Acidimicrobiia bacterium]
MTPLPVLTITAPELVEASLAEHGRTDMAVRIPGRVASRLTDDLLKSLSGTEWTMLIGGWSEPRLAMLPPSSRQTQIDRELELLRG